MYLLTLPLTSALLFISQAQAQMAPHLIDPPTGMDIQYSKFSRTTCMSSVGPIFTSKPGECIKLQDADHGIRVYPNLSHGQCKLRAYASKNCSGPGGKWIGIGACNSLHGDNWSLKVICPLVKI